MRMVEWEVLSLNFATTLKLATTFPVTSRNCVSFGTPLQENGFAVARFRDWHRTFGICIGCLRRLLHESLFRKLPVDLAARSLTKVCQIGSQS